jgi:hypothetical protein
LLKKGNYARRPKLGEDHEDSFGLLRKVVGEEVETKVIPTITGDYGAVYDAMNRAIHYGHEKLVSDEEILTNIKILQNGLSKETPCVFSI